MLPPSKWRGLLRCWEPQTVILWLGPIAVTLGLALHLSLQPERSREFLLAMASGALGFLADSGLIAAGIFAPVRGWMPVPFSPLWMVFLWINFATLLNGSLQWLHGRYGLARRPWCAWEVPQPITAVLDRGPCKTFRAWGAYWCFRWHGAMAVQVLLWMVAIARRDSRNR